MNGLKTSGLFERLLYDRKSIKNQKLLFDKKALKFLLIPLVIEQLLNQLMGVCDTMMVSRVGSASISAVSNVDSINILVIQVFSALATGAVIICSQYIGREEDAKAIKTAEQVILTVFAMSLMLTLLCMFFCKPILGLLYGNVDKDVFDASETYFFITALSFPFLALFSAASAFYRAGGDAGFPMKISVISNLLNIAGNAVLIFGFNMGVAGAAVSTLISRIFCMVVIFIFLRRPKQKIVIRNYFIKPDLKIIAAILAIGIPSGIENGMFQFGKLAIQSSVATLNTDEMAAQAMTATLEGLTGMVAIGIGIGMMTVVGQAVGAGRYDEAGYYICKLTWWAEIGVFVSSILIFILTPFITWLGGMTEVSANICFNMVLWITIVKPIVWTLAFVPAYGIRAAGDVKFSMIASALIMWVLRVALCVFLIRVKGFGPIAVWIAMFSDWTVRMIVFTARYLSGRWKRYRVI